MNPQGIPTYPESSKAPIEKKEIPETQMQYTEIPENAPSPKGYVQALLRGVLRSENVDLGGFSDYLDHTLEELQLDDKDFKGAKFSKGNFAISLQNGTTLWFSLREVQIFLGEKILDPIKKRESEEKIQNINNAIEAIFSANDGLLWDGEINDEDKVKTNVFDIHGLVLKDKTLAQLREMLDEEKGNLFQIYEITGESKKKGDLLKQEIEFFAGVGGKYEGGARYFSLSANEIDGKVKGLMSTMGSTQEIFTYIKMINQQIRGNRKKSDMVNQINGKLIESLYQQTFEKLRSGGHPNSDFIELAKIITGRGRSNGDKDGFSYEKLTMEESMKDYQLANEIIIHLMMKAGGVFESMKQNFTIEDPEVDSSEKPSEIIASSMATLTALGKKMPNTKTAKQLLVDMRIPDVQNIDGEYKNLSFAEKIDLGSLVRIVDVIENTGYEEVINNPKKFEKKLVNSSKDAYRDLNKDLSDHFDGTNVDLSMGQGWLSFLNMNFGGMEASDLGLSGEFGEVFNLYQDMNGNSGFFDWSDGTKDFLTPSLAGMTTLAASFIIFGIAVATLPVSATVGAVILTGAAAGAATGLVSTVLGSQGYDTQSEALLDLAGTMTFDAVLGAATFGLGNKFVGRKTFTDEAGNIIKHNLGTIPFRSKENLIEMGVFGGSEMAANMWVVAPTMAWLGKNIFFEENHINTETHRYQNGEKVARD